MHAEHGCHDSRSQIGPIIEASQVSQLMEQYVVQICGRQILHQRARHDHGRFGESGGQRRRHLIGDQQADVAVDAAGEFPLIEAQS